METYKQKILFIVGARRWRARWIGIIFSGAPAGRPYNFQTCQIQKTNKTHL